MKKILKETARFLCVVILVSILIIASSYHAYSTMTFFCIGLGIILLLFALSIVQVKRKKISMAWVIDIGISSLLIYTLFLYFSGLFWSEEYKFMNLVENYKNNTSLHKIENIGDIKIYDYNDIKFSDDYATAFDKEVAYDSKGNLLTGITYYSIDVDDGKVKTYNMDIYRKGKPVFSYRTTSEGYSVLNSYKNGSEISLLSEKGKGFAKIIKTRNWGYLSINNSKNKLRVEQIITKSTFNKQTSMPLLKLYDNNGKLIFEKNHLLKYSVVCYLKDGTIRPATKDEIKDSFHQKIEVTRDPDYEFTSLCQ